MEAIELISPNIFCGSASGWAHSQPKPALLFYFCSPNNLFTNLISTTRTESFLLAKLCSPGNCQLGTENISLNLAYSLLLAGKQASLWWHPNNKDIWPSSIAWSVEEWTFETQETYCPRALVHIRCVGQNAADHKIQISTLLEFAVIFVWHVGGKFACLVFGRLGEMVVVVRGGQSQLEPWAACFPSPFLLKPNICPGH